MSSFTEFKLTSDSSIRKIKTENVITKKNLRYQGLPVFDGFELRCSKYHHNFIRVKIDYKIKFEKDLQPFATHTIEKFNKKYINFTVVDKISNGAFGLILRIQPKSTSDVDFAAKFITDKQFPKCCIRPTPASNYAIERENWKDLYDKKYNTIRCAIWLVYKYLSRTYK